MLNVLLLIPFFSCVYMYKFVNLSICRHAELRNIGDECEKFELYQEI